MEDKKLQKIKIHNRILGYILLGLLSCITLSILVYAIWIIAFPKDTRIISFNRVSNLKIEDPVKIKGVTIGKVKYITKTFNKVLVTFEIIKPLTIYKGYTIFSADRGIMGDRVIVIINGNENNPFVNKNDTLNGIFYSGVSDVIGSAWKLKELADSFKKTLEFVLHGNAHRNSFILQFSTVITSLDTFTNKLYYIAKFLDTELPENMKSINKFSTATKKYSESLKSSVMNNINAFTTQINSLEILLDKLEKYVNALGDIIVNIEKNKLIHSDHINKLNTQLKEFRDAMDKIRIDALKLKLRISLGF